jgi:hypothetical protein
MRLNWLHMLVCGAVVIALAGVSTAAYTISPAVVGSAGGSSIGGSFEVLGTIGQPAIGVVSGGSYVNEIGFWYQPGWILTGVPEGDVMPLTFSMEQNSPNPFNPVTTIQFSVPVDSRVVIVLYNASGREIRTIVEDEHEAGRYQTVIAADGLPSGVYFCRMTAGRFVATRKMVLLK